MRANKPGQQNYYAGRGSFASSIPPDWQLEYAASKLAQMTQQYGGDPMAAARAWHRGPGLMNDPLGYQYQSLIQNHINELFPGGVLPPAPTPVPGVGSGVVSSIADANRFFLNQWGPTAFNSAGAPYGYDDCGPTSGAMVLEELGLQAPASPDGAEAAIKRVRDAALGYDTTTSQVMDMGTLANGLQRLGAQTSYLSGDVAAAVDGAVSRGHPVVLGGYGVWGAWGAQQQAAGNYLNPWDPRGHFVTVLGKSADGQYLVGDPLVRGGAIPVTADQLRSFCGSNGFGMLEVSNPAMVA